MSDIMEKKIDKIVKLRNVILIVIEILLMFVFYRIIFNFILKPIVNNIDTVSNLEIDVAHNVLIQINTKNDETYYIKTKIVKLEDSNIYLHDNEITSNNINGFAKKIKNIKDKDIIILENRPRIIINKIDDR